MGFMVSIVNFRSEEQDIWISKDFLIEFSGILTVQIDGVVDRTRYIR